MKTPAYPDGFIFSALAPSLRPALPGLAAGTLAAVLSGLAMLAALWCIVQCIAGLSAAWIMAALGLWIIAAVLASLASWLSHHAEANFSARLRRQLAGHLTRLPASTLARQDSDALRRLVSDDVAALHHMVAHLPSEIATLVAVPLASVVLLVSMAGYAALLVLLPGVLASLYYLVWTPRVSARHGAERVRVMGEITTAVDDYARGIRINRIYGAQSGALAAYHDATGRFTHGMLAWVSKVATPAAVAVALLQACTTFAIAYAVAGRHDAPTLAATLFFSLAVVTPSLRLGHGLDYVRAGRMAATRLAALLQEATLPAGVVSLPHDKAVLDVKNAVLILDDRRVLDGLSHRFQPGTLTAITGASGMGKTTLLRALAGLEPLAAGAINLAGINIATLDRQALQQVCLLIPQGGDVLATTVRENLALSAPDALDASMIEALTLAQLDVPLEADAMHLSGGERQRLGLARAFLVSPPVILLDEPSSALDEATAGRLMAALLDLAHTRHLVVVMVTHDLKLAVRADTRLELGPTRQAQPQS